MMDIMPTLIEASLAHYPKKKSGGDVPPLEGTSLFPAFRGHDIPERTIGFDHQGAHALRQGDWKIIWSKRMPEAISWELYNLADDRCEMTDLAAKQPDRVQRMASDWEEWASRVDVHWTEPASQK
jgi:arylsulfatase